MDKDVIDTINKYFKVFLLLVLFYRLIDNDYRLFNCL